MEKQTRTRMIIGLALFAVSMVAIASFTAEAQIAFQEVVLEVGPRGARRWAAEKIQDRTFVPGNGNSNATFSIDLGPYADRCVGILRNHLEDPDTEVAEMASTTVNIYDLAKGKRSSAPIKVKVNGKTMITAIKREAEE